MQTIDISKIVGKVHVILKKYPAAQDNDTVLYLHYLKTFHGLTYTVDPFTNLIDIDVLQEVILCAPPAESITRARRLLQAKGICVGSRRVHRKTDAQEMKDNINSI